MKPEEVCEMLFNFALDAINAITTRAASFNSDNDKAQAIEAIKEIGGNLSSYLDYIDKKTNK